MIWQVWFGDSLVGVADQQLTEWLAITSEKYSFVFMEVRADVEQAQQRD